jgi:hypothetical protein
MPLLFRNLFGDRLLIWFHALRLLNNFR